MRNSSCSLASVRDELAGLEPPVIVFNKSHSGSRLLAELIAASGVFMGAHCNESWDSLDLFDLVAYAVCKYYPDYTALWDPAGAADARLPLLIQNVFARHLEGFVPLEGALWGWKLCESAYILPILNYCFPRARFIHLIRDGRDVAFCDHRAPDDNFWRKIYFNTDRIRTYRGLRFTPQAYRRRSPIYNAIHWVNSVTVGRSFGMMLRERYLEVRYEDLCRNYDRTARRVLNFIGADDPERALQSLAPRIYTSSLSKHKQYARPMQRHVMEIVKPLLLSLGYLDEDPEAPPGWPWRSGLADNLIDGWRNRRPGKTRL
jgi:Sulfotransferase family